MKNIKAVLLVVLLIALAVATIGCGKKDTTAPSNSSTPSISTGPTEPNDATKTTYPAHTHEWKDEDVAATCTKSGYAEHICSICGEKYEDNETPALGHTWGEWKTTKEATSTANGS